jgi:hypothetical protein
MSHQKQLFNKNQFFKEKRVTRDENLLFSISLSEKYGRQRVKQAN